MHKQNWGYRLSKLVARRLQFLDYLDFEGVGKSRAQSLQRSISEI